MSQEIQTQKADGNAYEDSSDQDGHASNDHYHASDGLSPTSHIKRPVSDDQSRTFNEQSHASDDLRCASNKQSASDKKSHASQEQNSSSYNLRRASDEQSQASVKLTQIPDAQSWAASYKHSGAFEKQSRDFDKLGSAFDELLNLTSDKQNDAFAEKSNVYDKQNIVSDELGRASDEQSGTSDEQRHASELSCAAGGQSLTFNTLSLALDKESHASDVTSCAFEGENGAHTEQSRDSDKQSHTPDQQSHAFDEWSCSDERSRAPDEKSNASDERSRSDEPSRNADKQSLSSDEKSHASDEWTRSDELSRASDDLSRSHEQSLTPDEESQAPEELHCSNKQSRATEEQSHAFDDLSRSDEESHASDELNSDEQSCTSDDQSHSHEQSHAPDEESHASDDLGRSHEQSRASEEVNRTCERQSRAFNEGQQMSIPSSPGGRYVALYDFKAEDIGELSIFEGETFEAIFTENLWWLVTSEETGHTGYVPNNFLAPLKTVSTVLDEQSSQDTALQNINEKWYFGSIGRMEAARILQMHGLRTGDFLVRKAESKSAAGIFSLSMVVERVPHNPEVIHYRIKHELNRGFFIDGKHAKYFPSVLELVKHYEEFADGLFTKLNFVSHQDSKATAHFVKMPSNPSARESASQLNEGDGGHLLQPKGTGSDVRVEKLHVEGHDMAVIVGDVHSSSFNFLGHNSPRGNGQGRNQHSQVAAKLTVEEATEKIQRLLKVYYRTTGSYVQLLPGVDDDQRHIKGMYTKLRFASKEGIAVESTEQKPIHQNMQTAKRNRKPLLDTSEYDHLLTMCTREGDPIKRLIFHAMGGMGKSTFFNKVAYDWAVGISDVLKRYIAVFLLRMCALDETSDLTGSIFDQLLGEKSGITEEEVDLLLKEKPDGVLILLDGFDELKTSVLCEAKFGSVLKALNRQIYRECCICVTTRPSHLDRLMKSSLVQNPCLHVKVLGFTESDVKQYVQNFFEDDPQSSKMLIKSIQESRILSDLAKSPMLLLLICLLCRDKAALPETTSRLYAETIDYMFARKGKTSETEKANVLLAMGKVALYGLLANDQRLSFREDDFPNDALNAAVTVGILTHQRVVRNLSSHNNVQFTHKTMQEYCAAKYLQGLHKSEHEPLDLQSSDFQKTLDLVSTAGQDIFHYEYLLRFCCGDHDNCARAIMGCIFDKYSQFEEERLKKLLLGCYFESQSIQVPQHVSVGSLVGSSIVIDHDCEYFHVLEYLLRNLCRSLVTKNYLAQIESVNICGITNASCISLPLSNMANLRSLTLCKCALTHIDIITVLLSMKNNKILLTLDISENKALKGTANKWAQYMKNFTNLALLRIGQKSVKSEDVEHIALSVSDVLTDLDLSQNNALGDRAETWSCHLHHMTQLKRLVLQKCSLNCADIQRLFASRCDNLTDLDLSSNFALGGTAKIWSGPLNQVKRLRKLVLRDCALQCTDVEYIAKSISELSNISDLDLSCNRTLGGSGMQWAGHLLHMKCLQKLVMQNCALRGTDVQLMLSSIQDMANLSAVDISRNSALGGSSAQWSHHLRQAKQLSIVDMGSCGLKRSDVEHIALAVCMMANLSELDLSGNKALYGSGALWSCHLPRMKHIRRLVLPD